MPSDPVPTKGFLNHSAVTGWTVFRFHGARGGGPKGERNRMYRDAAEFSSYWPRRRWNRSVPATLASLWAARLGITRKTLSAGN
jgi:hypothetical protein